MNRTEVQVAMLGRRLLRLELALDPNSDHLNQSPLEALRKLEHLLVVCCKRVSRGRPPLNSVNVLWAYVRLADKAVHCGLKADAAMIMVLAESHFKRLGAAIIPDEHPLRLWMDRQQEPH